MMDALRTLVFCGVILWMIPTLWPNDVDMGEPSISMSRALFYVFGVWAALISMSAILAYLLRDRTSAEEESDVAKERT